MLRRDQRLPGKQKQDSWKTNKNDWLVAKSVLIRMLVQLFSSDFWPTGGGERRHKLHQALPSWQALPKEDDFCHDHAARMVLSSVRLLSARSVLRFPTTIYREDGSHKVGQ